jgi:tetratricopeptide (TPR) repeat protein
MVSLPSYARPISTSEEALRRAEEMFRQRRFRDSIPEYQEAIRLDPEMHLAHLGLGDAYYNLGEYQLATAHFGESLAIRPTPQGHRFLGDAIRMSSGDLRRARRCYEDALAMDPAYRGAQKALEDIDNRLS